MHMDSDPAYRPLTLSDVDRAASVIAQAFVDDPLCRFILPAERTRIRTLTTFFRAYGAANIKNGRGYGVGEPLQGAAYWQLPDQAELSISVRSLGAFLPLLLTPYPLGLFRARAIIRETDGLHKQYASEPHFYLDNIGMLPAAQGQGWSSRLIRLFLARADAQGAVVYTDTVTEDNVPFYQHFGFQCMDARPVPGTGITVYALRRPAAPLTPAQSVNQT